MSLSDNIRRGTFWIERIDQFDRWNLSVSEIANRLSAMLRDYGDEFVDELSAQEIVTAPERFYAIYSCVRRPIEIVGMIALNLAEGEISSLCVVPKFRNLGIGTKLVNYVLRLIRETSCTCKAIVYVQKANASALKLFFHLGFIEVGELETAKILSKHMDAATC